MVSGGRERDAGCRMQLVPLQETLLGGQAVERVIRLAAATDGARERKGDVLTGHHTAGIHLGNVDLHRGMVLGSDEAVGGRANKRVSMSGHAHYACTLYHLRGAK